MVLNYLKVLQRWLKLLLKNEKGLTLIEIVAAAAVFSLLLTAVLNFYTSGLKNWERGAVAVELQQNARIALHEITGELRYAAAVEGFNDINILPLYSHGDKQQQGARTLAYTSADGRPCEIRFQGEKNTISLKTASGPPNEVAYNVAGLEFFRYIPQGPAGIKMEAGDVTPMILVLIQLEEQKGQKAAGSSYTLQTKIRLQNMPGN